MKLKVVKELKMLLSLTIFFLVLKIQSQKSYLIEMKENNAILEIITRRTKTRTRKKCVEKKSSEEANIHSVSCNQRLKGRCSCLSNEYFRRLKTE